MITRTQDREETKLYTGGTKSNIWKKLRNDFFLDYFLGKKMDPSPFLDNANDPQKEENKQVYDIIIKDLGSIPMLKAEYYAIIVLVKYVSHEEALEKYKHWSRRYTDFNSLCKNVRKACNKVEEFLWSKKEDIKGRAKNGTK